MKNSFLKLALFGLILEFAPLINAQASFAVEVDPFGVFVPSFQPGFEFNISGLAIKPSSGNLEYAVFTNPLANTTQSWHVKTIRPQYHFGFGVGGRYVFGCTGNDLRLDWTHYSRGDANSVTGVYSDLVVPFYQVGTRGSLIRQAKGEVKKFQFDMADLNVGQFVSFGLRLQMRFFGGISVARIKETLATAYQPYITSENITKYTGIGPRFGIKANYVLCYGFALVGQIGTSVLTGTLKAVTNYESFSPVINDLGIEEGKQSIKADNSTRVVPSVDARLGASYTHPFGVNSLFKLEAGYQATSYINAIRAYHPNSVVSDIATGSVSVATMGRNESNFAVSGPYVTVNVKI